MPKIIEGQLTCASKSFAIVASRWNSFFCDRLVEGALDTLRRHGANDDEITVVKVPGSFELPSVAKRLIDSKKYHAIICLGVLIRGATPHFDYIAAEATKGIGKLGMEADVPVTFGVITCESLDQAIERSGSKAGNKGSEAALAAIEMVSLYDALSDISS